MRTYTPKPGDVEKNWYVIDATDVVLGRLAAQTANLLRGKHKPRFAPHADCGDYVIIINADKVVLTNEMFGYATTVRSLSQGRATYSMEFKHYVEAPKNVAEAVINKK